MTHIRRAWPYTGGGVHCYIKCKLGKVQEAESPGYLVQHHHSPFPGQVQRSTFRIVAFYRGFLRVQSYPTSPQLRRGNHFDRIRWGPLLLCSSRIACCTSSLLFAAALHLHFTTSFHLHHISHDLQRPVQGLKHFLERKLLTSKEGFRQFAASLCWHLHWSGNPRQYTLPRCDYREKWDCCRRRVPYRRAIRLGLSNCAKEP